MICDRFVPISRLIILELFPILHSKPFFSHFNASDINFCEIQKQNIGAYVIVAPGSAVIWLVTNTATLYSASRNKIKKLRMAI